MSRQSSNVKFIRPIACERHLVSKVEPFPLLFETTIKCTAVITVAMRMPMPHCPTKPKRMNSPSGNIRVQIPKKMLKLAGMVSNDEIRRNSNVRNSHERFELSNEPLPVPSCCVLSFGQRHKQTLYHRVMRHTQTQTLKHGCSVLILVRTTLTRTSNSSTFTNCRKYLCVS